MTENDELKNNMTAEDLLKGIENKTIDLSKLDLTK